MHKIVYSMANSCPECGFPLHGNESTCPECGCPVYQQQQVVLQQPQSPTVKTDWAQYFYECGVIGWEAFKKYAQFTGRASRREFFSLFLIFFMASVITGGLATIVFLLPMIGVWIRRMHDINKCGWWSCCPIANVFLALKKSDVGANNYGLPYPAKNLL